MTRDLETTHRPRYGTLDRLEVITAYAGLETQGMRPTGEKERSPERSTASHARSLLPGAALRAMPTVLGWFRLTNGIDAG